MSNVRLIIFLAAFLAASATAMRADDLSDLVAAVAATHSKAAGEATDVRRMRLDTLPRYESPAKIDLDVLDGVCEAMAVHASLDYILSAYDLTDYRPRTYRQDAGYYRPTLARGNFYRPVPGIITSRFGWRARFNRMHHGVDLHLNIGDTVMAAMSGVIDKVAYDHDGYGHYVVMTHPDGMQTVYGHLQYALVSQGQFVEIGRPVGIGGNTGNSTGPHLHFEARMGGKAIDPTLIFDFYGRYRAQVAADNTASAHSSKPLSGKRTYVVRQGDTAKSIARRAGISVLRLCQLNMIKASDPLQVGRMLKIR